ncbi:M17 family peptidase N-terminal domain-containing protein [Sphingomonas sp. OTU376]|uniref:M17 family peptidase N-terminal domain-containing protein n=1 Tax=Sphingomonas sp. OTU376 TaxID=3043863 RepID=UPI00313B3C92
MGDIAGRTLGQRHGIRFKVAQVDVVAADVDLLVVGMFEDAAVNRPKGGANQLDKVLHGTLRRLREGGIFKGVMGETLMLSTPPAPIRARSLMLIGMGGSDSALHLSIGRLTELAMRTALRMDAHSAGCLLAWSERDIPPDRVEETAAGMMLGALRAIEENAEGKRQLDMDWTFDIRNGDAERTAAALGRALLAPLRPI